MHFGIREHGMGAIMNGMALHGGIIPFGGTFLIFSDYMRPAIRLAAFMQQHVIFIYTHDSIGLGEDGPTHQPIEQLSALRAIPELTLIRPADANETAEAWRVAIKHKHGPVCLVLTRQKLGFIDREKYASAAGVAKGAYVLADANGGAAAGRAHVERVGGGARHGGRGEARREGRARTRGEHAEPRAVRAQRAVVSAARCCRPDVPRVAIEAAHPMSWYRWVGSDGVVLGLDRFGASAPYEQLYEELGLTVDKLVAAAEAVIAEKK